MENKDKIAWWRYAVAVPVYLVLSLIGGSVVLIINAFMPFGGRYMKGDLGYAVLRALTGPVGVILANAAVIKILGEKRSLFPGVLNVVAATVFIGLSALGFIRGGFTVDMLTVLLAGITAAILAVIDFKDYSDKGDGGGQHG